ncbi:DUF58 domain-containing protein [Paenibacillus crassostreae]|uniref:DUF58 domain-containing protein n=1 Tax=Paenibacillus crassostreae TaxID=1763538 RepID=A0A167GTV6_9BACL|nr:DUF58 domain-containing protein [Paenibacillus crassostreae]AOZ92092.1 hypothetical protein LPB68_07570 [Paenibacillus crassostreae]OAB77901.1 hypothetical protein PNBC_00650 [Paenibacillus crassostreae]
MAFVWLCFAGILVVLIQGLLFGVPVLRRISYTRHLNKDHCYAGDSLEMIEVILNEKRLPVIWLRLEAMLPASFSFLSREVMQISKGSIYQNHRSVFTLKPYSKITRYHPFIAQSRGVYNLETVSMSGGDLFGLFSNTKLVPMNASLWVYPKLLSIDDMPSSYRTWQGELEVSRWVVEDPFLILGTREYSGNDPMNRIHWKASARTGQLQVYKQGYTADPEVIVYVNVQVNAEMWNMVSDPDMVERALSYAATTASYLIQQGMRVGFGHNAMHGQKSTQAIRIEPGYGKAHLDEILKAMAEVEMKCLQPFQQFLKDELILRTEGETWDYLLITGHVSEQIEEQIWHLRSRGNSVMVLPVHAEMSSGKEAIA